MILNCVFPHITKEDPSKQMVNYAMLYYYGDECKYLTGGWSVGYSTGKPTLTKNSDNLYLSINDMSYGASAETVSKVDFTQFIGVGWKLKYTSHNTQYSNGGPAVGTVRGSSSGGGTSTSLATYYHASNGQTIYDYKIVSNPEESYYGRIGDYLSAINLFTFFFYGSDPWEELAKIAGVTATSVDDLLSKSSTILNNQEAVEFMTKKCTGEFMVHAIKSSTFLNALSSAAYANKVYANEHWAKFIAIVQ